MLEVLLSDLIAGQFKTQGLLVIYRLAFLLSNAAFKKNVLLMQIKLTALSSIIRYNSSVNLINWFLRLLITSIKCV